MTTQSGFANVNGTSLYYELAGSGPTVILIHGFSIDTRMWDDQMEELTSRYQVLRYDMRGFGRSSLPDESGTSSPSGRMIVSASMLSS